MFLIKTNFDCAIEYGIMHCYIKKFFLSEKGTVLVQMIHDVCVACRII